jgi:beta-mannosidase
MTKTRPIMAKAFESKRLTSGWSFKQTDTEEWLSVERVPTNVHLDLLQHEKYGRSATK